MTRTKLLGRLLLLFSIAAIVASYQFKLPRDTLLYAFLFIPSPNGTQWYIILDRTFSLVCLLAGLGLIFEKEWPKWPVLFGSFGSIGLTFIFSHTIYEHVGLRAPGYTVIPDVLFFYLKAIPNLFFLFAIFALKFFPFDRGLSKTSALPEGTSQDTTHTSFVMTDAFQKRYTKIVFWSTIAIGPVLPIASAIVLLDHKAILRSLYSLIPPVLFFFLIPFIPLMITGSLGLLWVRRKTTEPIGPRFFYEFTIIIFSGYMAALFVGLPMYFKIWECAECFIGVFILPLRVAIGIGVATLAGFIAAILLGLFLGRPEYNVLKMETR